MSSLKSKPVPEKLSVDMKEAASLLGIGRTAMFILLKSGALKSLKCGKRRLISVAELKAFLKRSSKAGW